MKRPFGGETRRFPGSSLAFPWGGPLDIVSPGGPFPGGTVQDELMHHQTEGQEWIHVEDLHDLRDWAIYFSVSKEKLREAVEAVGPRVEDVKRYLGK